MAVAAWRAWLAHAPPARSAIASIRRQLSPSRLSNPAGNSGHRGFQRGDVVHCPALCLPAQVGQFSVVEVAEMLNAVGWLLAFQVDDDAPGEGGIRHIASLEADCLRTEGREQARVVAVAAQDARTARP